MIIMMVMMSTIIFSSRFHCPSPLALSPICPFPYHPRRLSISLHLIIFETKKNVLGTALLEVFVLLPLLSSLRTEQRGESGFITDIWLSNQVYVNLKLQVLMHA